VLVAGRLQCQPSGAGRNARPGARRLQAQRKTVLTFTGYPGAGCEDPAAMREAASHAPKLSRPARTVVNIGAAVEDAGEVTHDKFLAAALAGAP
jgi:hypothetical protein